MDLLFVPSQLCFFLSHDEGLQHRLKVFYPINWLWTHYTYLLNGGVLSRARSGSGTPGGSTLATSVGLQRFPEETRREGVNGGRRANRVHQFISGRRSRTVTY